MLSSGRLPILPGRSREQFRYADAQSFGYVVEGFERRVALRLFQVADLGAMTLNRRSKVLLRQPGRPFPSKLSPG